jgi:hypothetical protein
MSRQRAPRASSSRSAERRPAAAAPPKRRPMTRQSVESEIETFRQLVITSRDSPKVEAEAEKCIGRLNEMFEHQPTLFTEEDVRFVNVLRGFLGERLEAHRPAAAHRRRRKREGDKLDHCWRCKTPVDERFTETCETCSTKKFRWMICPVCKACGCQRGQKVLV